MTPDNAAPVADLHPDLLKDALYRLDPHNACELVSSLSYLYWNDVVPTLAGLKTKNLDGIVSEVMDIIQQSLSAHQLFFVTIENANNTLDSHALYAAQYAMAKGIPTVTDSAPSGKIIAVPCYYYDGIGRSPNSVVNGNAGILLVINEVRRSIQYRQNPGMIPKPKIKNEAPDILGAIVAIQHPETRPLSLSAWLRALYCVEYGMQIIDSIHTAKKRATVWPRVEPEKSWQEAVVMGDNGPEITYKPARLRMMDELNNEMLRQRFMSDGV